MSIEQRDVELIEPMRELNKVLSLEKTALELQALLRVLRYTDCDTVQSVKELPITLGIEKRMAKDLYQYYCRYCGNGAITNGVMIATEVE